VRSADKILFILVFDEPFPYFVFNAAVDTLIMNVFIGEQGLVNRFIIRFLVFHCHSFFFKFISFIFYGRQK
jgi:hypothetical protein